MVSASNTPAPGYASASGPPSVMSEAQSDVTTTMSHAMNASSRVATGQARLPLVVSADGVLAAGVDENVIIQQWLQDHDDAEMAESAFAAAGADGPITENDIYNILYQRPHPS